MTMKSKGENYNLRHACHMEGLLSIKAVGSSLSMYINSLIVLGRQWTFWKEQAVRKYLSPAFYSRARWNWKILMSSIYYQCNKNDFICAISEQAVPTHLIAPGGETFFDFDLSCFSCVLSVATLCRLKSPGLIITANIEKLFPQIISTNKMREKQIKLSPSILLHLRRYMVKLLQHFFIFKIKLNFCLVNSLYGILFYYCYHCFTGLSGQCIP